MKKTDEDKTASEFLTPPQIAKMLRCAHQTVLNFINSGELKALGMRSPTAKKPRWRVRRADLETFIEAKSTRPAPTPVPSRQTRPGSDAPSFY